MLASPLSLSGDFAVDTNVLKVDATNNRVGVNITTPSHPLDVVGNTHILGNAYVVSGRLGIGTTSPGEPIHIYDTDAKIKLQNSSGTQQFGTVFQSSGTLNLQSRNNTSNGNIQFQGHNGSAGTQYGRFNSSGKFVIGSGAPSYSLHVNHSDAMLVPVGTTAQRPTAAEGLFRYNSDDDKFEGYTASGWGAIAGSGGGSSSTFLKQEFTGNGSTTAFTLQTTVTSEDNLIVFNEGVFQRQDSYAASGTTITFDTAPANGNKVVVYQMETGVVGVAPIVDTMTGDGSDTTLTLSTTPASENQTFLTVDGVMQHKSTYSISGTTLTFSAAPPNGSNVECITLVNSSVKVIADTDGDTQIQLEESTDEDKIRFDTGGFERVVIDSTGLDMDGRLDVGKDLRIRGDDSNANQGVVRFHTNSNGQLFIDPANDGSNTFLFNTNGNLTVPGDLIVSGSTTTLNTATLDVEDKNITLNKGSGDTSGSANGAGITIQDAVDASNDATILWDASNDEFDFSHQVNAPTLQLSSHTFNATNATVNSTNTSINSTNITVGNNTTDDVRIGQETLNITGGTVVIKSDGGNEQFVIKRSSSTNEQLILGFHSSDYGQIQAVEQGVSYRPLILQPNGSSVGIGTTSILSGAKLDVRGGNIAVGGYGGGTDYGMIFTPADSSTYWHIYNDTGGELAFGRNITIGSTEYARFDSIGQFGIGTNNPTEKLHVVGNVKSTGNVEHTGLTMTDGTDIDQLKTYAQTLTLTTSFADTGINGTDLQSGVYIVSLDVNDYAVGGGQYSEKYSGIMSWHSSNTNSTLADEIPLHRAGHAPNNGVVYLRILRTASADTDDLKLQIRANYSASGSSTYTFKFRRMI
jgi:hypothetical protein